MDGCTDRITDGCMDCCVGGIQPVIFTFFHSLLYFLVAPNGNSLEILHVEQSQFGVLTYLKASLRTVSGQKVSHLFVVDLQHTEGNRIFLVNM